MRCHGAHQVNCNNIKKKPKRSAEADTAIKNLSRDENKKTRKATKLTSIGEKDTKSEENKENPAISVAFT